MRRRRRKVTGKSALSVVLSIALAFGVNMAAEMLILSSERRVFVSLGKSLKATIIPALIAAYALIIANALSE